MALRAKGERTALELRLCLLWLQQKPWRRLRPREKLAISVHEGPGLIRRKAHIFAGCPETEAKLKEINAEWRARGERWITTDEIKETHREFTQASRVHDPADQPPG